MNGIHNLSLKRLSEKRFNNMLVQWELFPGKYKHEIRYGKKVAQTVLV